MMDRMEKLISRLDVKGIEQLWLRAKREEQHEGIHTLRGLAMDRLEELNPEAFEQWLEADDDTDFSFFY